ncbi:MAG: hypothetical protein KC416_05990 [Myxococcales bacterium]|nr:hypothetical protein [Myxococcales bacterium]
MNKLLMFLVLAVPMSLTACGDQDEGIGEKVEEAADDTADAVDEAGDEIEDKTE